MSTELNRKFSSLRPVFKDLVIKKAALKWNTTVYRILRKVDNPGRIGTEDGRQDMRQVFKKDRTTCSH